MKLTIPFELELEVQYDIFPPTKGARDSLGGVVNAGPPIEPDEPGYAEVYAVRHNGILLQLSDAELEQIEEMVYLLHQRQD